MITWFYDTSVPSQKLITSLFFLSQIACLICWALIMEASMVFYLVAVGGATAASVATIYCVDLLDKRSCGLWFVRGIWYNGGAMVLGAALELSIRRGLPS